MTTAEKRRAARATKSKQRLKERATGFLLIAQDVLEGAQRLAEQASPDLRLRKARRLLRLALAELMDSSTTPA